MQIRPWLEGWWQDVRFGARQFRRAPLFVVVVVLTLALGIGAATAIFSVINGVLLKALPYPDPSRIVQVWESEGGSHRMNFADPNFYDLRAESRSFVALAEANAMGIAAVTVHGSALRAMPAVVSSDFFRVLGVQPARGRTFSADETREGGARAVILSYGFWQRELAGKDAALGDKLEIAGTPYMIVGVMPANVDYPAGTDMWLAREVFLPRLPSRTAHNWNVVGRLADGVTLAQTRIELTAFTRRLKSQYLMNAVDMVAVPLQEQMVGGSRRALLTLLVASVALLLIACANVVNLLVARMSSRQGELAVRLALGAARYRLIQQALAESLMLSLAAGMLGILIALAGIKVLIALRPTNLPRLGEIRVDWIVLAFAILLSVVVAVVIGLVSAWRATGGNLREALTQSQRTQSGAGTSAGIRRSLAVGQVAMTLVLLIGAGLLGRSFIQLLRVDPGFRTDHAVILDMSIPGDDSAASRRRSQFYDALLDGLRTIPGVARVGAINCLPLANCGGNGLFLIMTRADEHFAFPDWERFSRDTARTSNAEFRTVRGDYFGAMGISLIRGRVFDSRDTPDAPHVGVISASLAKRRWPRENPIGKVIQYANMDGYFQPITIVGIVSDVRETALGVEPRPTFYASHRQRPGSQVMYTVIATHGAPAAIMPSARRVARDLAPAVPPGVRTMESIVSRSIADRRFILFLVGVFAAAALVLAALGVYSVMSYLVAQRSREISIRVALGARAQDIVGMVVRQGAILTGAGIAIGALASIALTRLIGGLLYGITPTDPASFIAVTLVLALAALAASYVPARRASRVDAMNVLRGG